MRSRLRSEISASGTVKSRTAYTVLMLALVTGCEQGIQPLDQSDILPPARTGASGEAVDGLTVGHRLMESGEYELALKAYSRTIPEHGLTVDVLSAIGSANLKLGRLGQAESYLRRAVEVDSSFVPAWNNLGVVLISRQEYSEAREVFRVAFGLDRGNSTEIRDNLMLAEQKMQNIETPLPEEANFRLVRRGSGRYLLLGE